MELRVSDQTNKQIEMFYDKIDKDVQTYSQQFVKQHFPEGYRPAVKENVRQVIVDFMELKIYRKELDILFNRAIGVPIQDSPQYSEPLQMIDRLIRNGRDLQGLKQYVFEDKNYKLFKERLDHLKQFCKEQAANYLEFQGTGNPEYLRYLTVSNCNIEKASCDYAYTSGMFAMNNYYTFMQLNNPVVYRAPHSNPEQPIKRPTEKSIKLLKLKKFVQKAGRTLDDVFNRVYDGIASIPSRRSRSSKIDEEWQRVIDENKPKEESIDEINARLERDHRLRADNVTSFNEHMRSRAKPQSDEPIMTLEDKKKLLHRYYDGHLSPIGVIDDASPEQIEEAVIKLVKLGYTSEDRLRQRRRQALSKPVKDERPTKQAPKIKDETTRIASTKSYKALSQDKASQPTREYKAIKDRRMKEGFNLGEDSNIDPNTAREFWANVPEDKQSNKHDDKDER